MSKWKRIKEFPDYEVSTLGEVRRISDGRVLSVYGGAKSVIVYLRGRKRSTSRAVSFLVAHAFLDNPQGYRTLEFIDGDCNNCSVSNLRWRN